MQYLWHRFQPVKVLSLAAGVLLSLLILAGCAGTTTPAAPPPSTDPDLALPAAGRSELLELGALAADVWTTFRAFSEDWNARIADCDRLAANRDRLSLAEQVIRARPINADLNALEEVGIEIRTRMDAVRDAIAAFRTGHPSADAPIVDLLRSEGSPDALVWAAQIEQAIEGRPDVAERFPC